jgi:hypothetical protein
VKKDEPFLHFSIPLLSFSSSVSLFSLFVSLSM